MQFQKKKNIMKFYPHKNRYQRRAKDTLLEKDEITRREMSRRTGSHANFRSPWNEKLTRRDTEKRMEAESLVKSEERSDGIHFRDVIR
jgi:hypothetical protein